jgi:hypothetical protein
MYPNLLEAPCGENLHIALIDSKKLAARLEQLGIGVDTAIVKTEPCGGSSTDLCLYRCDHPLKLKLPPHEARQVYVRICEICWSCGECQSESF